jgi:hypothetical protein
MSVGALIADMVRAGVDPDLIGRTAELLAAREAVTVKDEQAERRRAADRERKAFRRIPQNSAEAPSPLFPPSFLPPETPNQSTPYNPPSDGLGALTLAPPKPEKPKKPKAPSNDDQVLDKLTDALMPDTARALMDHRKRLGKPLTPKAAELIARDILKLPAAEWEAAAEMMIARGWQGFNVDWYRNATQPRQNLRFGA